MSLIVEGGYDSARYGSLQVTITETGGGGHVKTATLAGTYFPIMNAGTVTVIDDDGYEVTTSFGYSSTQDALNTAFSTGLTSAITCTIVGGKWRFSSNGAGGVASIAVTFNADAERYFGSAGATYSGALTHTMAGFASRYIVGACGGLSDVTEPHEVATDLATDIVHNDGSSEGISMPGAAYEWEAVVPFEPELRVWHNIGNDKAGDGTWETFFRQMRNIEPLVISWDDGSGTTRIYVSRLLADACAFEPERLSDGYRAYANIRLRMRYLGTIT